MLTPEELNEFNTEAIEILEKAETSLLALDDGAVLSEHFDNIFRAFHNLKGAAGMMELMELQSHVHQLENILTEFKGVPELPKEKIDLFLRGIDATKMILRGEKVQFQFEISPVAPIVKTAVSSNSANAARDASLSEFFSECAEILNRIALTLEKIVSSGAVPELIDSLYRDVHSLKGGAFLMGYAQMGELSHALENCLEKLRESRASPEPKLLDLIFKGTDVLERIVASIQSNNGENFKPEIDALIQQFSKCDELPIEPPKEAPMSEQEPIVNQEVHVEAEPQDITSSTIRVPVPLLDKLMTLVGEMVLVRNQVIQYSNKNDDLEFSNLSQRLNVVTGEIQGEMMKTRMQPIGTVLSKFQRVVRDLSRDLKKKIDLTVEGSETELDKTLLEAIKDPLTHIIRNSCDHGVETPEERKRKGKSEAGLIKVRSYHEGGQVIVEIADDGKGLHREKLIAKALEKKLITPEKAASISDRDAMNLIFAAGFSTAAQVTNVSGRGVGMDVVRSNIDRIGGTVELESVPEKGTTIRLKIPLTLAIVPAMIVRAGTDQYAIPQIKLVELVRIERGKGSSQIEYLQGKPVLRLRGNILPLLDIKQVLKFDNHDSRKFMDSAEAINIVVLNSDRQSFGLIVDEILDTADIVVKPLSRFLKSLAVYSGATVLGDGSVALILDVAGVANLAMVSSKGKESSSTQNSKNGEKDSNSEESQEFLLFRLNSPTKHAVYLGYVHRLEEFKRDTLEYSGGQRVVRYRDAVMPIVSLNETLNYKNTSESSSDLVSVIVTQKGGKNYGIEVNEIIDVLSTTSTVDESLRDRPGLLGNIVTQSEVVVVVDPHQCLPKSAGGFKPKVVAPQAWAEPILTQNSPEAREQVLQEMANLTQAQFAASGTRRILFAEDTAFFRKHVTGVLERAGYEVVSAKNGEEALAALEAKEVGYYSVVLSDIEMPKLNGFELATAIRRDVRWKSLPLVALTTKVENKDRQRGKEVGFTSFLEKLDGDQLLSTLDQILTLRQAA